VIDEEGFRLNVGIILVNQHGRLFWGRRIGQDAWQFPQGGIQEGETPEEALFRELREEVGLESHDVTIMGSTQGWLRYRLPKQMIRHYCQPLCIGQKQKWFLLRFNSPDSRVQLDKSNKPEFDRFRWVSYWYPLQQVIPFKRHVYRRALQEFASLLFPKNGRRKEKGARTKSSNVASQEESASK